MKNITKIQEFIDCVSYKAHCGCFDNDHIQTLFLEYEPDTNLVTLQLFANVYYAVWKEDGISLIKTVWRRLKISIKLLFTGNIQMESSFVFYDKESINDYIQALNKGLESIKKKEVKNN